MTREIYRIRKLYRKGVSISEIARRTGRVRTTIRRIVTAPDILPSKRSRQPKAHTIDPSAYTIWTVSLAPGVVDVTERDASAAYTPTEDLQEPPQTPCPALAVQSPGDIPATPDPVALAVLPVLLDAQDHLSVLDRYPNFFVLATSYAGLQPMTPGASNGASQQEERNGKVASELRTLAVARNAPARSENLLNSDTVGKASSNGHSWQVFSCQISVKTGLPSDEVWVAEPSPRLTLTTPYFQKGIKTVKTILAAARIPAWLEIILVMIGLMASLAAHVINMFNFPRYELDEGTYMASAWAILNGQITPYAYGYGHPPLAWMQIAAWIQLTGGFFTFGNALNSGRVLMLLYELGSTLLVYLIARRMSGSRSLSLLALILFSLSPLSIFYQRQVFLDNVGTFWLLLSLYLIVAGDSRLSYIVFAALSYGVALLSKEVFVLFMPVMIYAAWLHTTNYQRKFALVTFTYTVVALGSGFVLMAILKGELFPYSWHLPWDHHPHLSMLDTLVQQAQRGQIEGRFIDSWYAWTQGDPLLMMLSVAATIFNLITGWWNRRRLLLSLLAIIFWILLVRGGVVLSFYIIPMIPLVALNTAIAIHTLADWTGKLVRSNLMLIQTGRALLILAIIGAVAPYDLQHAAIAFTQHPTSAQTDAMVWVRNHVPHNAVIVINSYLYMDLRQPGGEGSGDGATYPYASLYWNVAFDPVLHDTLLQGNWDRIDYIVADSEMLRDITTVGGPMLLLNTALQHSILRAEFRADDHDKQIVISIYQVMHKLASPTVYSNNLPCYQACQAENDSGLTGYSGARGPS